MSQMCTEATRACTALTCTHASTPDQDGDGHADIACGGDDCDDMDAHRYPGNPEVCLVGSASGDGGTMLSRVGTLMGVVLDPTHDEDCDPTTFASATTGDGDHDMDGYVDSACANVDRSGMRNQGTDCDDLLTEMGVAPGEIHPMETETCNGVDDNCNGVIDESGQQSFYPDCDGDGFGSATAPAVLACHASDVAGCNGHLDVLDHTDCNDTHAEVHPGATEICDGLDDDCNPATTDPMVTCYRDADGDGYRSATVTATMCSCGGGWLPASSVVDCYDTNPLVHPGPAAFQTTDRGDGSFDYDCNGTQEEQYPVLFGHTCLGSTSTCDAFISSDGWYINAPGAHPPPCGMSANYITMVGSTCPCFVASGVCYTGPGFCSGYTTRTQGCR